MSPLARIQYTLFNQYGVAHITVTVTDAGFNGSFGDEDDASISQIIDAVVNSVNDPPIAAADSFTVSINSSANTLNVLTNDSIAPDSGEVLRVIFVGPTSGGGNVVISTDRSKILYSPARGSQEPTPSPTSSQMATLSMMQLYRCKSDCVATTIITAPCSRPTTLLGGPALGTRAQAWPRTATAITASTPPIM